MKKSIKFLSFTLLAVLVILSGCSESTGSAETDSDNNFPEKTIEMVVPFPPGGATDLFARLLAETASDYLPNDQSIVVINQEGGSGVLGLAQLASAKPDGYQIALTTSGPLTLQTHLDDTPFEYDEFEPIMRVSGNSEVLVVNSNSPWETYEEFVEHVKNNPDTFNLGTIGPGTLIELLAVELNVKEDIQTQIVPYEGNGDVLNALLGEQIDGAILTPINVASHIESGALRPLVVNGENKDLADVPTFEDKGVNIETSAFLGIIAPKGVPENITQILQDSLKQALEDPELVKKAVEAGSIPSYADPETFMEQIENSYNSNKELMDILGVLD